MIEHAAATGSTMTLVIHAYVSGVDDARFEIISKVLTYAGEAQGFGSVHGPRIGGSALEPRCWGISCRRPRSVSSPIREIYWRDSELSAQWERCIFKTRLDIVTRSAPQFQPPLATLIMDPKMRRKVIMVWKEKILGNALVAIRRFQERGELRKDVSPGEMIARAVISLNVSYLVVCALLAPEADWDHERRSKRPSIC